MPDNRLGSRRESARARGRVPYVWVSDDDTGHRYDVLETAVRDGMTPVEGVEPNYTGRPRPTKHFTGKDGESSAPRVDVPSGDAAAAAKVGASSAKAKPNDKPS